jgi:predicted TIM-barrel fold metal-dependent hydrolase
MMNAVVEANRNTLLSGIDVVDVDAHYTEPADLWISRAPARWKDRVPQIREVGGKKVWCIDDGILSDSIQPFCQIKKDGTKTPGLEYMGYLPEDAHPAASDVKSRLKVLDAEGIWAQIVYPNLLGFGGAKQAQIVDEELRLVSVQIFNDAMAEMQEASGNRIFPMALMPWWDINAVVNEIKRCHGMGLKGINTNSDPQNHGLPDLAEAHWNPMWAAAVEYGMPINFHIGASDQTMDWWGDQPWPSQSEERRVAISASMLSMCNIRILANIITSGILDRFPALKFVSVESGIGWVPFMLESLEYQYKQYFTKKENFLRLSPWEYFERNIYSTFWFERAGFAEMVKRVGVNNVMFETDFPHPSCLYPEATGFLSAELAKLDMETRGKIMGGNAAKVYGLPARR